jgi:hypothetical protein
MTHAAIIDLLTSDRRIDSAFRRALTTNGPLAYRPAFGRWGRAFLSRADADAYDRGWATWPHLPAGAALGGPMWTGHQDRDADQTARDDMRADAAADSEERECNE